METKPLLYGLIGFLLGGLLASFGGTVIHKRGDIPMSGMSMAQMSDALKSKSGDDFDKQFLSGMIAHHEGAIEMAKLAKSHAKHDEVKKLADDILAAQSQEIDKMQGWQANWGYKSVPQSHDMMNMNASGH